MQVPKQVEELQRVRVSSALSVRLFACILLVGAGNLFLGGCADLPRDAPTSVAIRDAAVQGVGAPDERVPYVLVNLSPSMLPLVNDGRVLSGDAAALARLPKGPGAPASAPISVGDILAITIFEAQAGGLFIPNEAGSRSGNFIALPNQQVDAEGYITVPYTDPMRVVGQSAKQVSTKIAAKLASRAIEPQVVVSIAERRGNEVSVLGEVNQPARFALDPGGVRLSGAIAHAGGTKFPDYDTAFSLERRGVTYRSNLATILTDPRLDAQVQPNDVLYLTHDPRFVSVFGGTLDPTLTNISRRVMFESRKMNLAEALAKAGGLNTARADARAVFALRLESKRTLNELGIDTSAYVGETIPTVYSVNLATTDGFFLSDQLQLRTHDIIIVSEAPYADFVKFFALFNSIASVPTNAATIAVTAGR